MICAKCKLDKSTSEFYRRTGRKDGSYQCYCKSCLLICQRTRWKNRKRKMVDVLGGKCSLCGYCKNLAALELHHLDPKTKDFDFNKLRLRTWSTIIEEIKKCILLCSNCHREIHNPNDTNFSTKGFDSSNTLTIRSNLIATGKCPICDTDTYGTKFCSTICVGMSHRKIKRPSREQLELEIKTIPFVTLGKKYGVSDNAIRKWCKTYGIVF